MGNQGDILNGDRKNCDSKMYCPLRAKLKYPSPRLTIEEFWLVVAPPSTGGGPFHLSILIENIIDNPWIYSVVHVDKNWKVRI